MTDSITMAAITEFFGFAQAIELTINAGADMISIASGTVNGQNSGDAIRAAIVDAVNAGRIPMSRIDESYTRIMALRALKPYSWSAWRYSARTQTHGPSRSFM
jgi:beta-N-acetylhexosaminidase